MKVFYAVCFLLFAVAYNSYAGIEPNSRWTDGPFSNGSSLTNNDIRYNTGVDWGTINDLSVKNSVSIIIDDSKFINYNINYTIALRIDCYDGHSDSGTPSRTYYPTLHVSYYQPGQNIKNKLIDSYNFAGAYKVVVTVVGSPDLGGFTTPLAAHVKLNSEITINRQYQFQPSASISPSFAIANSKCNVSWSYITGAEQYDVEWTTINNGNDSFASISNYVASSGASPLNPTLLPQIFRNNASRMTTDGHDITIPLIGSTDQDILLVRIRQTQYKNGVRLLGNWDYLQANSKYAAFLIGWNESTYNWQFSNAFAEDGKNKAVISYFDGTLRNRQTVTLNNSDNVAVAQENVYDEFGRTVASILPAPHKEIDPYLHYIPAFNLNTASTPKPYSFHDMVISGAACNINPGALNTSEGASSYYSSQNKFLTSADRPYNKFIPDAQGYPLSITQYTDDNTNRVKLQGGVGSAFQPGSFSSVGSQQNKVTQYFYGVPQQWELDQLFGNDAGYAEHYLKNMVVDPNGQASVSYINASGKTVATALAGDQPANLDDIDSHKALVNSQPVSQILKPEQFIYNTTDLKFTANTTFLSTGNAGPLYFNIQQLVNKQVGPSITGFTICSSCYYKVTIKVTDACGTDLSDVDGHATMPNYVNGSVLLGSQTPSRDCIGDPESVLLKINANVQTPGEYHIAVEIAYDKDVIDNYVNNYMDNGVAAGTITEKYQYIQQYYINSINASGYYNDCHTCQTLLGGKTDFVNHLKQQVTLMHVPDAYRDGAFNTWAGNLYDGLSEQCNAAKLTCGYTPCEEEYSYMLKDVSPGGQYALFDANNNAIEPVVNAWTQIQNSVPNWKAAFPDLAPSDPVYQADAVILENGTITSPYDASFTLPQLIKYWKPDWAVKFVPFHPEICKYNFCSAMSPYTAWDLKVQKDIVTAADVTTIKTGSGTPAGLTYSYSNAADWLLGTDPFFSSTSGSAYYNQMQTDLLNYSQRVLGIPVGAMDNTNTVVAAKSLMAYIDNQVYCTDPTGTSPNNWTACAPAAPCRFPDKEWAAYREAYFALKQKYYDLLRKQACPGCTIGKPLTVTLPGAAPTSNSFTIKQLIPAVSGSNAAVVYNPGKVSQTVTIRLYYPSSVGSTDGLTTTLTFNPGDSHVNFFVPNNIPFNNIHVLDVKLGLPEQPASEVPVVVADEDAGQMLAECEDGSYYVPAKLTTIFLPNGPTDHDVNVTLKYTVGNGIGGSSPGQRDFTIPAGQTSVTDLHAYTSNGISLALSCEIFYSLNCIQSVRGATLDYGSFSICDGGTTDPGTTTGPINDLCATLATKIPRFPDAPTFDGAILSGQTSATINQTTNSNIQQQAHDMASGKADSWADVLSLSQSDPNRITLKNALVAIASAGSDNTHPEGVSVLPGVAVTGTTIQPYIPTMAGSYHSFGDAIKGILLGGGSYTATVNPWLINGLYPYDSKQITPQTISSKSTELCNQLSALNAKKTAAGAPDLYTYLVNTYRSAMTLSATDLQYLVDACNTSSCTNMLSRNITLPVFMDPKYAGGSGPRVDGYITASDYLAAKADMNNAFNSPLTGTEDNYPTILTNYMNFKWGYSLSYNDYKDFDALVNGNPSSTAILPNQPLVLTYTANPYAGVDGLLSSAMSSGFKGYDDYLVAERNRFRASYMATCALSQPSLNMNTSNKLYHYTLYYYDQADNLVRTVPPEGVHLLPNEALASVALARQGIIASPSPSGGVGPVINTPAALQSLSDALTRTGASAIETWLYNANGANYHVAEATTDKNWLYQFTISGNTLGVDIYPMTGNSTSATLNAGSLHYRAAIASGSLTSWTHVVVQAAGGITNGSAPQIWLNGTQLTVSASNTPIGGWSMSATSAGMQYPNDITDLRYMLTYNRTLTSTEIITNAHSTTFTPKAHDNLWYSFNVASTTGGVYATATGFYPTHTLTTDYAYNSTNQVIQQHSPDGGTNNFWYDLLSRLTVSQNDKQLHTTINGNEHNFSYTDYEPTLGRIQEVGQLHTASTLATVTMTDIEGGSFTVPDYVEQTDLNNFKTGKPKSQITHTYYDDAPAAGGGIQTVAQNNLRKRVAASTYRPDESTNVQQATYYNYDIDGNVKTLYQQIAGLNDIKQIDYEYDLVSGKVNFIRYQDGKPDQFYYRYKYDADNRITEAWSGTQAIVDPDNGSQLLHRNRRMDAEYFYYLHGPLARVELGDEHRKVQGIDYAYTLQGWLKGVNSTALDSAKDIGHDGSTRYITNADPHSTLGRDVYGYALHYYDADYTPIGGVNPFAGLSVGNNAPTEYRPLFNGNIAASSVNLNLGGGPEDYKKPLLYVYAYDQLNRIIRQDAFKGLDAGNTWTPVKLGTSTRSDYHEDVNYDANGNIKTYNRNGYTRPGNVNDMDALQYAYNTDANFNKLNNKLRFVNDAVAGSNYGGTDLPYKNDSQGQATSADNYQYDDIGNLIKDAQSGINTIDWTVYGKIASIDKGGSNNITYTYDVAGHRVSKTVGTTTTWYVRDAQGNPLALYDNVGGTTNWKEQQLYGSSRLGQWQPEINITVASGNDANNIADNVNNSWNTSGDRFYELTNHLGNVMATITDKRVQIANGTNDGIGHYEADVATANDYYPFGSLMPGRNYKANNTGYRYGFNGKENDNDVKGEGDQQDYGMRIYDPRVGRFLSVDPLSPKYPELTPYQFASNRPIDGIDQDGLEYIGLYYMELYYKYSTKLKNWYNSESKSANIIVIGQGSRVGFPPESKSTNGTAMWVMITTALQNARHEGYNNYNYRPLSPRANLDVPEVEPNTSTTNKQVTAIHGSNTEAADENTKAQKTLQVDKYKILRNANVKSGLSMDHIPSFASLKDAEEARLGRRLTAVEERTLHQNSLTLAIRTKIHQTTSETYGGRNTAARRQADAQNPLQAIKSNVNALRPELLKDGYTNAEIDKAIQALSAPFIKK